MSEWIYADVWETIADLQGDALALSHGDRHFSWREFDQRADGIGQTLLDVGARHQDKVAMMLYNCPEYLETTFACLKTGLVPVNTNYRYREDELVYLWDNADAVAVVFHGVFADRVDAIRGKVPDVHTWIWVDDGSGACPDWAIPYEKAAASTTSRTRAPWGRDGSDLIMIYTGGTTGMPKGVMWRQHDQYCAFNAYGDPTEQDLDIVAARVGGSPIKPVGLPGSPVMHATGFMFSLTQLNLGGRVATLAGRHFDVNELFGTIEREKVTAMAIVGDAFARPMLAALDETPDKWDVSSLMMLVSAGVMWSAEVKEGLARHLPHLVMIDVLGSTEAHGIGTSVASGGKASTGKFSLGENALVVTDDGRKVEPGSGEVGKVAVRGYMPLGYYKDQAKTDANFLMIEGERLSVPGDYATVEADGTITLLGRGSVCINTGGEKVFPEEVEEALKTHPAVTDATVVGIPDERFGQAISAVVTLAPGASAENSELIAHVKGEIAGYKAPKHILVVESLGRGPNGKADYAGARERVIASLA